VITTKKISADQTNEEHAAFGRT